MEIVVCVRRVPEPGESELEVASDDRSIVERDLEHGINEWDDFAIEAAVQLKEAHGARVTALTVGGEEAEDVLRRALAMGVDEAVHLMDPAFDGSDAWGIATVLGRAIARRPHDLVLAGAVSSDEGRGHVGGMLAAALDLPIVALATELSVSGSTVTVRHEVEEGMERVTRLEMPALITVQTGINEPRYVSIRGIRKAGRIEIPVESAADLGVDPGSVGEAAVRVRTEALFPPPKGRGAELLEGDDEEKVAALADRLHRVGGP